jgi:predicted permease
MRDVGKEQSRDEFRAALIEDFARDMRHGARALRRSSGFAVAAISTLALGVGAATAVFSVVNGVLLTPLPYPEPDRIVRVFQIDGTGRLMGNVSEPNFLDWQALRHSFEAMAQIQSGPLPVAVDGEVAMTSTAAVSREFFDVFGVGPAIGRGFSPDELHPGATPVAIVSARFWRSRLAARPLGDLSLRIGERLHTVIGVMPDTFDYPVGVDAWSPRELHPPQTSRTAHNFQVLARLADGVPLSSAVAEVSRLSRALKARYGDGTWMSDATAVPLRDQITATARPTVLLLFVAAMVLLLIACLNVSNLQLARTSTRRRELAVRLALGAGRGRLARQLLAEALLLSLIAAAAGVGLAYAAVQILVALQPANLPRVQEVAVDTRALGFAIAVACLTAIVLGLTTAMRASSREGREMLAEGARTTAGGRTAERVRQTLAVAQVALTITLLAGAGLLGRSFVKLLGVDPGYRTSDALLLDLQWPGTADASVRARRRVLQQDLMARLRALPGVTDVGLVSAHPLGAASFPNGLFIEMTRPDELKSLEDVERLGAEAKARAGFAGYRIASEGYFPAMGISLIRGRLFGPEDSSDAPHVAVISASLAETKWPGQDPIGRFIQFGNMDGDLRGFRVVGVVGDVREVSPEIIPGPLFYAYYRQRMAASFTVVVHARRGTALAPAVREIVRSADPELPLRIRTAEEALDRALAGRRFSLTLIGVFSVAALVLATLGVYGLIAYLVAERTREIGIRLALGAAPRDVLRLVLGQGVMLAGLGLAVGVAAFLLFARFVEGMLYGVGAADPVALSAVAALTLAAVLLASYVPARRAMRVSPGLALRTD